MSHELRTPLTAVLGFSQLLRDDPSLTETQKENLDIINRSGAHLLALINDVLDMSKIEAGQLGLQETVFSLSSVMETVEEMMRVRADAKGLSFVLDRGPTLPQYIKADERKLKQILINLAGNAVKFTKKGGVVVRVRMEGDGTALHCDVEDTGPGIHSDDIPNLFDRFVQVGEDHEGVGLGLYISRKLVELMGGRITVASEPEKGSQFSFTIRCAPATIDVAKPLTSRGKVVGLAPGQATRQILIVEDKLETRLLVVKLLQAIGFHVLEAENGHEAIKRFETHRPDLILMDMRMPIMDGYRATRRIKATERGKATPIIALTASAFDEERQKTLAAGADDHLGKPIKVDELYETIRVHLGIEYAYVEPESVMPPVCDRAGFSEMVAALPEGVANGLAEAIMALDLDGLMTLIPDVSLHAPVLAEHLTKLAKGYEITKLAELLETRYVP
jgi:two-component system sensor histidine kinase/response regulator